MLCISGWAGDDDQRNVLEGMREAGLVDKLEGDTDNDTLKELTLLGAASLQCSHMLAAMHLILVYFMNLDSIKKKHEKQCSLQQR